MVKKPKKAKIKKKPKDKVEIKEEEIEDKVEEKPEDSEENTEEFGDVEEEIEQIAQFDENHEHARHFSIGEVGLATAKGEVSWQSADLEGNIENAPVGTWEEHKDEDEFDGSKAYGTKAPGDMYEDSERGDGMYNNRDGDFYSSSDSVYGVENDEGLRDIRDDKGEKKLWDNSRLPGMSRLEHTSFEKVGSVSLTPTKKRGRKDHKYE
jgi:hypothetical protein